MYSIDNMENKADSSSKLLCKKTFLSFIFTLNLEYHPGNIEKLDRIVDAIEAKRNWQWMFPHRFTGMELYWREKCGSSSYLLPLLCRFHRSVVGTSQVEKAAHFFPIFFLTYPSTIMSSFRTQHNFSLAKKRLTKIWSNSLVKSPHTRIQPQRTHRYCFFFYPFHDRYIESFERKTLPSILLSHDAHWFFIGYIITFFALWTCHNLTYSPSPAAVFTRR